MSVCGTDTLFLLRGFSWQSNRRICLSGPPFTLDCNHCAPELTVCVPPSVLIETRRGRNINRLSIRYALRPRVRIRLTLSGLTFLRNPQTYGDQGSHLVFRYLCWQSHFSTLQPCFRSTFTAVENALLPIVLLRFRNFGVMLEPRYIVGAEPLDQ